MTEEGDDPNGSATHAVGRYPGYHGVRWRLPPRSGCSPGILIQALVTTFREKLPVSLLLPLIPSTIPLKQCQSEPL